MDLSTEGIPWEPMEASPGRIAQQRRGSYLSAVGSDLKLELESPWSAGKSVCVGDSCWGPNLVTLEEDLNRGWSVSHGRETVRLQQLAKYFLPNEEVAGNEEVPCARQGTVIPLSVISLPQRLFIHSASRVSLTLVNRAWFNPIAGK